MKQRAARGEEVEPAREVDQDQPKRGVGGRCSITG